MRPYINNTSVLITTEPSDLCSLGGDDNEKGDRFVQLDSHRCYPFYRLRICHTTSYAHKSSCLCHTTSYTHKSSCLCHTTSYTHKSSCLSYYDLWSDDTHTATLAFPARIS